MLVLPEHATRAGHGSRLCFSFSDYSFLYIFSWMEAEVRTNSQSHVATVLVSHEEFFSAHVWVSNIWPESSSKISKSQLLSAPRERHLLT